MKMLVEEEMKQGAFGMSTGLIYPPGMFTSTEEIIELAKVVGRYGGYYGSHRRGETATLLYATQEVIRIAEEAKLPAHIHHMEAYGTESFWKIDTDIGLIEEARNIRDIDITYDSFPYAGANTTIMFIFPPWALEGGVPKLMERLKDPKLREKMLHEAETYVPRWPDVWSHNPVRVTPYDWILIIWCASEKNKHLEGKTLAELGKIKGKHPFLAAAELAVEENGAVMCIYFGCSATKEDEWRGEGIIKYLKYPYAAPSTDAIMGKAKQHPAGWGMTARVIGRYARDMRLFTIEEAVRKLTSLPAHRINCQDRGLIREGMYADIVIFNPRTIIDTATYHEAKPPTGVEYVLINGKPVLEGGEYHKNILAGKVLRGPGYKDK
jgi:N-acyl-D-amino-acid deacylase